MAQITINVGTVANDGTGDTLRGAFSNTNSNFTELYSHNTNVVSNLVSVAVGANAWSNSVGTAGNNYTNAVGLAGNNYTNTVGLAGNNYTNAVGLAGNNYTNTVGSASNTYTNAVGLAGNNYTNAVGLAGNNYTNAVGLAGNNYTNSVGSASNTYTNAVGLASNNYTNVVGVAGNNYSIQIGAASNTWANLNFTTISNGSSSFNHANAAFDRANNSLQNTSIYLNGVFNDVSGPIRSKFLVSSNTADDNFILESDTIYTSNTSVDAYYDIVDDSVVNVTVGSYSTIINLGTGKTIIRPNGSVSVFSANGLNLVTQYAVAEVYKVAANTWVATGNLSNA